MTLKLSYHGVTSVPVEVEGLTPDWACDKSLAEIERFEIFHGNRKIPLTEMFRVSGGASDKHFEFEGNLSGVHWIGAHMTTGRIDILGPAGRHIGSEMRGGEIYVEGNAGGWTGAEMHGGFIHVRGNAGHLVGAAYRGSAKGMTGGTIIIDGNAGNEIGLTMRRGLIAVGGSTGDMIGFNMIAGTILAFGECGIRPGAGMRRGTIGLLGPNPPRLLPSFRYASTFQPQVVSLLLRDLRSKGMKLDESLLTAEFDFYLGDLVAVGKGEILFRHERSIKPAGPGKSDQQVALPA
ncbi:MAG: Formylmethanofuran dehydrogenase subunit [Planctomycetaceae bacterium]|nr:Formylmethanofuran dehydrogenase subunit [Planctomycetaceae bacterium]